MKEEIKIVRGRVACVSPDSLECLTPGGEHASVQLMPEQRYLAELLRPGMRVNLVDVRHDRARFFVAEPDYLGNATAVAGCMADSGDSELRRQRKAG